MLQAQADIEFYLMKINRLQSDLSITQNQLLAARLRLRTAQDYQIKYQLLVRQSQEESERQKAIERQEQQKIAELIALKLEQRDQYWQDKLTKTEKDLNDKNVKQINKICQQYATFRKKHEKCGNKFDEQDLLVFKNKKLHKQVQVLQQKIDDIKKQHQRWKQAEIKLMKQTIVQKNKQKQQNERKVYRQKIEELQKINSNLQFELLDARTRSDPNRQKQIQKLKAQLNLQIQKSNHELEQISLGLLQKNRQIEQLLNQKYKVQQVLIQQKRQLKQFIKTLEDKLYDKERQHQVQLINLKQRMGKIRDEQAQDLKNQIHRIQQSFQIQRDSWIVVIFDKDKQILQIRNKFEEETQKNKDDKVKHIKKIDELKKKLKQYEGQKQAGQTQQLIKSIKDIAGKQQDFASYENGVTFLDRQLKKALAKIQQKSIQITKLIKQLNELRKQSQDQINCLRQKSRKDKKTYGERILQLQQQIKDLNDQIRNKQKQFKRKQKEYQSKISHNLRQNSSLKDSIKELQKDYTRAIQNKKAVQESYRQQRQRGMTSKSDLTMVKKQKWIQMQKQKNQLQVIYKQKQQQLKNKYEVQNDKIRHQRDDLKRQNQILRGMVQAAKKDGEQNKQNKQALYSEYHKKMASLNLEIALTKNIYDALIQAKSRRPIDSKVSQFEQDGSISQPNIQINSPPIDSHQPYFGNYSGKQKLGLSFNPSRK